MLLDGRIVAKKIKEDIAAIISQRDSQEKLILAVLLVGNDVPSAIYAQHLEKIGLSLGIAVKIYKFSSDISTRQLLGKINRFNNDPAIAGILPMMPLPKGISPEKVAFAISPEKDVDALNPYNIGLVTMGKSNWAPCTAQAVMAVLDYFGVEITGKRVVIIGRSNVVGKPLSLLLLARNATVTVCHSYTVNLADEIRQGDIVVAAVGKPRFITADMIKPGAIIIDVGINQEGEAIVGDVDFGAVQLLASAITPVPGGIGSVSSMMMMKTLLERVMAVEMGSDRSDDKQLTKHIEELRQQLYQLVAQKGSFCDEEVASLSAELDLLIVQYEMRKHGRIRSE